MTGFFKKIKAKKIENIISVLAFLSVAIAWYIGSTGKQAELEPFYKQLYPNASSFNTEINGIVQVSDETDQTIAYLAPGKAHAYGGDLKVLVSINKEAEIIDLIVVDHKETHSYFKRVINSKLLNQLKKKSFQDSFDLGNGLDGVAGATYTSKALAISTARALKLVANEKLELQLTWNEESKLEFGRKEILLILLFIVGLLFSKRVFPQNKIMLYIFFIFGIISLGFYYNGLLTITTINKFLMGMWPSWYSHFFSYLLMGGVLALIIFSGNNVYCSHVCPFGSTQKCLGLVGGTHKTLAPKITKALIWVQRFLSLALIIWGLLAFNPSAYSYEVFAPFFQLYGTTLQFILLIIVILASLFYRRPWCNYLCPVKPFLDYVKMLRNASLKMFQ